MKSKSDNLIRNCGKEETALRQILLQRRHQLSIFPSARSMFASCPNTERGIHRAALRQTAQRDTDPSIPVRLVVKTDHSCLYPPGRFCKHQVSSVMTIRREGKQPRAYRKLSPSWPAYVGPEGAVRDAGREKTSTILASSRLRCSTGNGGMKVIG